MIKEALQYVVGLNKAEIVEIEGHKYSDKALHIVKEPTANFLRVTTLTSLVDYIKQNADDLQSKLLLHIESPSRVKLYSSLNNEKDREDFIDCEALLPSIALNRFVEAESFNIMMQSSFIRNEDAEIVLKVVGNIKDENVSEYGDDGVSQKVTIKAGVAKLQDVKVPNPVLLAPYRTFQEIEQPESKFVFRMQSGPKAALFEADGGAWRNEAMIDIKYYLTKELEGLKNITIVC